MPLRQLFESPGLSTPASLSCLRGHYSNMALGTVKGSILEKTKIVWGGVALPLCHPLSPYLVPSRWEGHRTPQNADLSWLFDVAYIRFSSIQSNAIENTSRNLDQNLRCLLNLQ